ncbi:30S ribosomal protein S4 [uncultured archaeon]|nr:30S ribosomal protein S4 [uncultured archaeon]
MGDIKRKPNLYSRPRKAFDAARIAAEKEIVQKYGLKSKREIWKASAKISTLRNRAKTLIPKSPEEKKEFFNKLNGMGLNIENIADVLALKTENWLDRRLQTIVFKKGLAKTPLQARQIISHNSISVNGRTVNVPSFFVTKDLESKISLIAGKIKEKKEAVVEQ